MRPSTASFARCARCARRWRRSWRHDVSEYSPGRHITDEELLLDYYNESEPADRTSREGHLASCEACRALDREMRAVLAMVDTSPSIEAPPGFGREMWARVEPHISARANVRRSMWATISLRQWALAGGMVALLVASFTLGRVWERAPQRVDAPRVAGAPSPRGGDTDAVTERLLRAE